MRKLIDKIKNHFKPKVVEVIIEPEPEVIVEKKFKTIIVQSSIDDKTITVYNSIDDVRNINAFEDYNIRRVLQCCKGLRHTYQGYKWRFEDVSE